MADPNVLGLNIELQLRSNKFQDSLTDFMNGSFTQISEQLSSIMTTAMDSLDFTNQLGQLANLSTAFSKVAEAADFSSSTVQISELSAELSEAASAGTASLGQLSDTLKVVVTGAEDFGSKLADITVDHLTSEVNLLADSFTAAFSNAEDLNAKLTNGTVGDGLTKELALIDGQAEGFKNVAKAIATKNLGHDAQNKALDESNAEIKHMNSGMGDSAKSAAKTARVYGFMVGLLKNIVAGVHEAAKGADGFATVNFRAYGHQESILINTQLMAGAYGVLGRVALEATKALMEEGLKPERIVETTLMVSKLTRVTGVGAEVFAETARQMEIMGASVSETGELFNIAVDAQRKYNLNAKETTALMKKIDIPSAMLGRTFLTTTKSVLAFADTKAEIAGFAKSAGADVSKVVSYLDEIAKGSVEATLTLMALSNMGKITPENTAEAFQRGGGQILEMLNGLEKGTIEYNMQLNNIMDTYHLSAEVVASMIKADEEYLKQIEKLTAAGAMTQEQAVEQIKTMREKEVALKALKVADPTAYLIRLNADYCQSIDNVTYSKDLMYAAIDNIGSVLYSMFFPAFALMYRVLGGIVSVVAMVIEEIRDLWRGFVDLTGMSQTTVYAIKAILGIFVIGGLIIYKFGGSIMKLIRLLPFLGAGLVWLKEKFLGLFTSSTKTTNTVNTNVKSLGARIKDFFMELKDVATTMIKVAFAMLIMAGAVLVLSFAVAQLAALDYGKLWSAVGAVAVLMAILVIAMILLKMFAGGMPEVLGMAFAMLIIAGAVLILSSALTELAALDYGKLWSAVGALAVVLILLVAAVFLLSLVGPLAVPVMLALAVVFLALGVAVWLVSQGLAALGTSFSGLMSNTAGTWDMGFALMNLALGMLLVTSIGLFFAFVLLVVGTALTIFGIAMYFVRTSLEIVGNALLNLGNGMVLIVENSTKLKDLSKGTVASAKDIGDALMTIANAVNAFDIAKSQEMATVLSGLSTLQDAGSVVAQIGVGFERIAEAAKHGEEVNTFSKQLTDSLTMIADNVEGVDALQSIADTFASISASVAELDTVNEVMTQLKNGVGLFDEIGDAPDNIERIAGALGSFPDLSSLATAATALGELSSSLTNLLEVAAMEEAICAATNTIAEIGPSLAVSAALLLTAMPLMSSVSTMMLEIAPSLFLGSVMFAHAGVSFGYAGEYLRDGVYHLAEAVDLMAEIDFTLFLDSVDQLSSGLGSVSNELFFNALKFKISMAILASAVPTVSLAADEVDRLALALGQLADNIASLNRLGSININAESMVEAASKATEAVENYQNTMAASQEKRTSDKKSMDSQPISQVQTKTERRDVRDEKDLQPSILHQLEIITELLRASAAAKGTTAVGAAAAGETRTSDSGSASFNIGSWF